MTRPRTPRAITWLVLLALLASAAGWSAPVPTEAAAVEPPVSVPVFRSAEPTPLPDPQLLLARVYFDSLAERDALAARLDAVETGTAGGYVTAILTPTQHAELLAQGYRVEIDAARTALLNVQAPIGPAGGDGIPGFECYRTVEATYAALSGLAAAHPELAEWLDIGDSWEKVTAGGNPGHDLHVLKLTNENLPGPKPAFFLMAAIHAREYTTAELATRYAEYLVTNYGIDSDVTWLLDNFEVHILPQANPDGRVIAEGGDYQRKNTNPSGALPCANPPNISNQYGVDLNRNFDWHWNTSGVSSNRCDQTYPGLTAASEPETQAIQAYLLGLFPDQRGPAPGDAAPADANGLLITLHSYGNLVLFPWGDTPTAAPNQVGLQTLGRKFGYYNLFEVCQPSLCLYDTSGTTDDWLYGQTGVAAYTFEMGNNFFQGCSTFENSIYPRNLAALLYAFKAARRPYQAPAGPETLSVTVPVTTVVAGTAVTLTASATDARYASGGHGSEPTQAIAAARYSWDTPAWVTGTATFPLAAADGVFNANAEGLTGTLDTTGLTPGRHLVLVESQDANGNWGVPSAAFLNVLAPPQFALGPSPSFAFGDPGQPATHTLTLTNTSALTATYMLSTTGGTWLITTPLTIGPVAPGAAVPVTAEVAIDGAAAIGEIDEALLTVALESAPTTALTATLVTAVHSAYGVYAAPAASAQSGQVGTSVTYTVVVTSLGDLTGSFSVSLSGQSWTTTAPLFVGPLSLGQSTEVTVTVQVPYGVPAGATDTATVTITSNGDPGRFAAVTVTTTARWRPSYLPQTFN